jgi:hypothetical protein
MTLTLDHHFHRLTGGIANTTEFSRYKWWNRHTRAWEPYEQRHLFDYAREALHAVAAFHTQRA